MRRRLLVLSSLLATALLLWLLFAGDALPDAGPLAPVARNEVADRSTPLVARPAARAERAPVVRKEVPVEKQVHLGDAGGPPSDPRIYGQVSRGGWPVAGREVHVLGKPRKGGTTVLVTTTDALGQYDFPVPGAGSYRVRVAWDGLTQLPPVRRANGPAGPAETAAANQEIIVADQPVACDLVLPSGSLRVTALDARTRLPLPNVEVALTWSSGIDLTGHTDREGQMLATDLPAGPCTVDLALRGYRAPPPFTVDTSAPCPEERAVLLEPACVLDLHVCDERGAPIASEDAPTIEVVHTVTGAVHAARRFRPSCGSKPPRELPFDNLEEGTYGVRVADQLAEQDGEPTVRFQSAEGLAMKLVTVVPGRATEAEFRVRWRTYVEILGTTSDRKTASALLRVERLDPQSGIRRALPAPQISVRNGQPPQFAGWLAEGTYWLTFTSPQGQVQRESLQVADKGIKRSFQLPW